MIISIGRQTGSGGREIAQKLADETGFKYLDKDALLRMRLAVLRKCIIFTTKNL